MIPHARSRRGIRPVEVSKPKARGRGATRADERIHYSSSILPKWARRTKSLDILLPALYLRGVSTGDFQDVLTALLGKDAPNLSPSVIGRLKSDWEDDYRRWQASDLSARRYVYVWADGVYLQARMEPQAECILVLIGATPEGKKERSAEARTMHLGARDGALARYGGRLRLRRRRCVLREAGARSAGRDRRGSDGRPRRAQRSAAARWPLTLYCGAAPAGGRREASERRPDAALHSDHRFPRDPSGTREVF